MPGPLGMEPCISTRQHASIIMHSRRRESLLKESVEWPAARLGPVTLPPKLFRVSSAGRSTFKRPPRAPHTVLYYTPRRAS